MSYRAQVVIALLSLAGGAIAGGPGESVQAAALDAPKLPAEIRQHCRYLSLYNLPAKDRAEFFKVLTFHCNSLSREADLVAPVAVGPDVLRVNMLDYGWDRTVWEKLASVDPYFHVRLADGQLVVPTVRAVEVPVVAAVVLEGVQFYRDGPGQTIVEIQRADIKAGETVWVREVVGGSIKKITAGQKQASKPAKAAEAKTTTAQAPWLPAAEIAALALAVNSESPIVRADWFLNQTAIQAGRDGHGYYDWLGLGKAEKDFQELVGVDVKGAQRVKREMAASIAKSGVTLNNRGIEWYATITGDYYRTQDFKTSTFKQNTIRLLDGDTDPPKGDASEQYGTLPNGLFAFWLQNADGVRQDSAPDFIASDGHATGTDRRVHAGLSCIRCHVEGIRPLNDWLRRVYTGPIQLTSPDYLKLKRLRQLYLSDLDGQVKRSQRNYAERLLKVNGLTPEANARAYARVWDSYFETDLGIEDVCRELNVKKEVFMLALKAYAGKGGADPILTGLLANPPERIRREHFEEAFAIGQTMIRGTKP